jgi:hypothetical protein
MINVLITPIFNPNHHHEKPSSLLEKIPTCLDIPCTSKLEIIALLPYFTTDSSGRQPLIGKRTWRQSGV